MSSSTSSATVAVEKATSDLLIAPDWTMNIDICDSVNSNHWYYCYCPTTICFCFCWLSIFLQPKVSVQLMILTCFVTLAFSVSGIIFLRDFVFIHMSYVPEFVFFFFLEIIFVH